MTDEELEIEMENSIDVKEQLPQLAKMLKDYPLFDDVDFYLNSDDYGFKLYIGVLPDSFDYLVEFNYDFPTKWQFTTNRDVCLMWYEAELLYVFQDCCEEMCEIVKNYNADKAAWQRLDGAKAPV